MVLDFFLSFFLNFRLRNCSSDFEIGNLSREKEKVKKSAVKMELEGIMREVVKCNEVALWSEVSKRVVNWSYESQQGNPSSNIPGSTKESAKKPKNRESLTGLEYME